MESESGFSGSFSFNPSYSSLMYQLISSGLFILIFYIYFWLLWKFSGDVDSVVPVTATRYSLAQLKLATKVPWYPWYVKKQVRDQFQPTFKL